MSSTMMAVLGGVFIFVLLFIAWLKYREHLHLHRHEHGPHGNPTKYRH